ncbi:hypothetical protein PtB15_12B7 [Puccinia triticina]|nr:hypothetical protein PtB15_12B7 [Puccinia triticina]
MRIHFQTSAREQDGIQVTIPQAIVSYVGLAAKAGVDKETLGKKLTADATPKGTHCVFDGKVAVSSSEMEMQKALGKFQQAYWRMTKNLRPVDL